MKLKTLPFCLLLSGFLAAQDTIVPKRNYHTAQLPMDQEITLDATFDEPAYNQVEWTSGFTVHRPNNGEAPTRQTMFKIVYDLNYIYVAYRCLDEEPEKVEKRLGRRDNFPGDWVEIHFDSYRDNATAFSFTVSASGVKGDEFISGNGNNWDESWNPIWYVSTGITEEGWAAEIKIPFSQLRFAQAELQDWGFNVMRRDFRADERSTYQFIPQNAAGWVSNYARLKGFKNLKPKRQIETQPYVVAGRSTGENSRNRFNVGLDGKIGVTNNITMDYTINPDFGQVDADPSALNIDGFEIFFQERRPFFIENGNLFDFRATNAEAGGPYNNDNLFYSRRIGARPSGNPVIPGQAENRRTPDFTNILGASKVSGKTRKGWSIGLVEGITSREFTTFDVPGDEERGRVLAEPLTNYFVSRLSKDINGGESQIGGTLTNVYRFLDGTGLEDQYHETASSGGFNVFHSWEDRSWQINVKLIGSQVTGTQTAIERTQRDFRHYFQRPDADHLSVDPTKTTLNGHGGDVSLANYGGKDNISYQGGITWRSPGLELNDIGFLNTADAINHYFWAGYRAPKPFSIFRSARINYNHYLAWTFDAQNLYRAVNTNMHGNFKNYWEAGTGTTFVFRDISNKALFGGPLLKTTRGWNNWAYVGTDTRKRLRFNAFAFKYTPFVSERNSVNRYSVEVFARWQMNNAFSISAGPEYSFNNNALQNVSFEQFNGEDRYVTGRVLQRTLSASVRLSYSFTPNLTLEYWGQPFISQGEYSEFKYISDPLADQFGDRFIKYASNMITQESDGTFQVDENNDGQVDYSFSDPDFNFMQFRSNAVVRWEYIPGSELFLVWSQGTTVNGDVEKGLLTSFQEDLFSEKIRNNFLVKLTYRLINK
ncbi:DUF5916 domain-containing protein [Portibacter marinus]|uniref:DUF5916 domain-containing protein n=1 Tax=Portibacter marinus TaxID=2898660 RepID=UPI001F3C2BBB|nr:DUF5916 domain-containing protein [Portibacter marinus]